MSPTPLSPSTVHILLQYISPPSQLLHPLPPFLLSKALLQRHHFLAISPNDPHEYLCWPSSLTTSLHVVHLLESLPRPSDDDQPVSYPVQYTSDDEHTCAHVHITSSGDAGLRFVFQWDESDGWKFHDANLMPFPAKSTTSLLDALRSISDVNFHLADARAHPNPYGFETDENESDDDDYWNAYGAQEFPASSSRLLSSSAKDADANEDAYWARYSSVHGTADSTRPSPRLMQRRNNTAFEEKTDPDSPHPLPVPVRVGDEDMSQVALPIPPSSLSHAPVHSPWDPASPQTLARLLADLSPRHSPAVVSQTDDDGSDTLSPTFESSGSEELETPSPLNGLGLTEDGRSFISPTTDGHVEIATTDHEKDTESDDEAGSALRDSIRGLYALWKTSLKRTGSRGSDRDAFMRIVDDAVA